MNRTDYITGLRTLADLLDRHDDLPLPYSGSGGDLQWIEVAGSVDEQRAIAQMFARLIPGTVAKTQRDGYLDLSGMVGGVRVKLIVNREAACVRVVKGVREVTREVPDPDALAAVPTVTVTETVEDVEWVCEPLLTERVSA